MPKQILLDSFANQQESCRSIGSPFYSELLACSLTEAAPGVPFWDVLDSWVGDPLTSLLSLRMLGALHDLVLSGRAPDLAATYPSPGCSGDTKAAWTELNLAIERERDFIAARLDDQVQTNEVRRCAALLPGFLVISERARFPLRLAELGASAGLNLCWDAYRYELGDATWGSEDAPLALKTHWTGPLPTLAPVEVTSRRGCDIAPLDMSKEDDRRRLQSFVWPDQFERLDLLRRAIAVASERSVDLVRMSAGDFVDEVLAERRPGEATVIYHSIMWVYVPEAERHRITRAIERAGAEATNDSPVAWLRMEFADTEKAALWLDYWPNPDGTTTPHTRELLAHSHYHGTSITWFGADADTPP